MTDTPVTRSSDMIGNTCFTVSRSASAELALSYSDWLADTVHHLEYDVAKAVSSAGLFPLGAPEITVTIEVRRWAA